MITDQTVQRLSTAIKTVFIEFCRDESIRQSAIANIDELSESKVGNLLKIRLILSFTQTVVRDLGLETSNIGD